MPTYPSSVQPMKARKCRPKQNANVLPQKKRGPQARRVFPIKTAVFRRDIPTSVQILGNWRFPVKYECPVRHPVPGSLWSHFLRTRRQIYHPCTSPPMCLPESQLLPSSSASSPLNSSTPAMTSIGKAPLLHCPYLSQLGPCLRWLRKASWSRLLRRTSGLRTIQLLAVEPQKSLELFEHHPRVFPVNSFDVVVYSILYVTVIIVRQVASIRQIKPSMRTKHIAAKMRKPPIRRHSEKTLGHRTSRTKETSIRKAEPTCLDTQLLGNNRRRSTWYSSVQALHEPLRFVLLPPRHLEPLFCTFSLCAIANFLISFP